MFLLDYVPQVEPLATRVSKCHDREVRVDLSNLLEPFRTGTAGRDGIQMILGGCRYEHTSRQAS